MIIMVGISNIPIGLPFMGASNGLTSGLNIKINGVTINSTNSPIFVDIIASGNVTILGNISGSGDMALTGKLSVSQINNNNVVTTLAGTTSGSIIWNMPEQGQSKKVIIYFNAYENDTTTPQVITFPIPFTYIPSEVNAGGTTGIIVTATDISIDPDTTTTWTGYYILEGY